METLNNKFKVLSIDAWADGDGDESSWSWNQWFNTGDFFEENIEGPLTEDSALRFFFLSLGYKGPYHKFRALYYIDDDQYNLILCDKKDDRPLYAIEYGSVIY